MICRYKHYGHKYTCMLFKCSISSGAHYQPHYTWLIVHTTTATHNTVRGLKLICMFFFDIHYLLSCPRYMHLNLPTTVHPNRPNTTDLPKHCIDVSDPADFIRLSDMFLNNRCLTKLVSWGPWVPWVYSTCILTAFCFESLSPSQDNTRRVCIHTCYNNHS